MVTHDAQAAVRGGAVPPDREGLRCPLPRAQPDNNGGLLASQGDHSCTGGYAYFEGGVLIDQAGRDPTQDKFFTAAGDDYIEIPGRKLSAALGVTLVPEDIFNAAFPGSGDPPLFDPRDTGKTIRFDPSRYDDSIE